MKKIIKFMKVLINSTISTIVEFIREIIDNAEAVTILVLSAIGTMSVLTEIPFYIAMPLWAESAMVIPFISFLFILFLVNIMKWRMKCYGTLA